MAMGVGFVEYVDREVRWAAAKALGQIGSAAVPSLLRLLEDADSGVRWATAKALGQAGSAEAVPSLLRLLEDADSGVRSGTTSSRRIPNRNAADPR